MYGNLKSDNFMNHFIEVAVNFEMYITDRKKLL